MIAMNEKTQKLVDEKLSLLGKKGFYNIEMLNRSVFKAKNCGDHYNIRLNDDFFLTLNNMGWGYLK